MMEEIRGMTTPRKVRRISLTQACIAWSAIGGGVIVILGACLPWFSLFAGLQPYRGVDVLNGRLLTGGGILSLLAGAWFFRRGDHSLRWGIGLLGFVMLAFASWSVVQLFILYRELAADPMLVAKPGPGLIVVTVGALLVFATLFLSD